MTEVKKCECHNCWWNIRHKDICSRDGIAIDSEGNCVSWQKAD